MSTYYLVTPLSFWESILAQRTSVCQRMKFTDTRKETEWGYITKAEAFEAAQRLGLCVISETRYSDDSWKYQLLLQTPS
jgi:hypothetical protein